MRVNSPLPPPPRAIPQRALASTANGGDGGSVPTPVDADAPPLTMTGTQGPKVIPAGPKEIPQSPSKWAGLKKKIKKLITHPRDGELPTPSAEGPQHVHQHHQPSQPSQPSQQQQQHGGTPVNAENPFHRAMPQPLGVVTFAADIAGIEFYHVTKTAILKKQDVEEVTLRNEIFASLSGPVSSKDQIRCTINQGRDNGVTIEGLIDRVLNPEAQSWIIARLADFLNGPNVFAKTLAPFLTMSDEVGSTQEAQSKILVKEARINDVPIRTNAPVFHRQTEGQGAASAGGATPSAAGHRKAPVVTPTWNPELSSSRVDPQAAARRHAERMNSYKARFDLSVPTPHDGRFERTFPSSMPAPAAAAAPPSQFQLHPSAQMDLQRSQRYVTPSREAFVSGPNYASPIPAYQPPSGIVYYDPLMARGRVVDLATTPRRGSTPTRGGLDESAAFGGGGQGTPRSGVYRTRQYVVEDSSRRIMRNL